MGGDDILHYLGCSKLAISMHTMWPTLMLPNTSKEALVTWFCMQDRPSLPEALRRCMILDLAHKAFAERRGFSITPSLVASFEARLRFWSRQGSAAVSGIFRDFEGSAYHFGAIRMDAS